MYSLLLLFSLNWPTVPVLPSYLITICLTTCVVSCFCVDLTLTSLRTFLSLGFHVWPCWGVWKFRRHHFYPRFQAADGSRQGMLDNRHHMYGSQCTVDGHSSPSHLVMSTCGTLLSNEVLSVRGLIRNAIATVSCLFYI